MKTRSTILRQLRLTWLHVTCLVPLLAGSARASIAYGSINNFDTVNDTGHECHGFEIELDDCHSTDITYTYNYNHYGVPEITEDNSVAGHPKVIIKWQSKKNTDGSWASYTAIPSGTIAPTDGHQFTNPGVNFGGEHFGVGYSMQPSAVLYNWLIDNGSGVLVHGGAVQVATPTFTYFPLAAGVPAAQVQAVIVPPPPPVPPVKEFGKAVWVKEIKTTSHNAGKVKLRELVSDDPDNPNDKNWKNGEQDEVEMEWRILQKKTSAADGGPNGELAAAPEALPNGNEVVTRRYEFYKYVGPLDAETGEAMGDAVAADGIHGTGSRTYADHFDNATGEWVTVTKDMATFEIVGEFTGSQMAAVDVNEPVGLIDHVGEGKVNKAFAPRTVVVEGALPFECTHVGSVPPGMTFNDATGILSGTPTTAGQYSFSVTATDGVNPDVKKNYTMSIAAVGAALPAQSLLDTTSSPVGAGTTTGDGAYAVGADAPVTATASAGYHFVNWTDNGQVVSANTSHTLVMDVNHSLVANFAPDLVQWNIMTSAAPVEGGTTTGDGLVDDGTSTTVTATANAGYTFTNWTEGAAIVSANPSYTFVATADRDLVANFTALPTYTVSTSAAPVAGGTTAGDGNFVSGTSATVTATTNAGYFFVNWTVGGTQVSTHASYTFNVTANTALVANFAAIGTTSRTITTSSSPVAGGTTTGGGTYADGSSVTVVATPAPGYKFSKWKESGSNVSDKSSYTFTVSANRTLVASFTRVYYITGISNPPNGGTTEADSSSYPVGDNGNIRAFPASDYEFVNWTENGTIVGTGTTLNFTNIQANHTYTANFQPIGGFTYSISTGSSPSAGGSTSGDGTYISGDSVTVSAVPNPGYVFSNWTRSGGVVSTTADYTFTASANLALVAHFVLGYDITTDVSPPLGGTATGGGVVVQGSGTTLTASPAAGYTFLNWTDGLGNIVSTNLTYTFSPTQSDLFTANFQAPVQGIHFDFDNGTTVPALHAVAPFTQTVAGMTASFSSPNATAPTVENAASTGHTLSKFSGKYLAPSDDAGTVVEIAFDQQVTGVELTFATVEPLTVAVPSDVQLTAYDNSSGAPVLVGTAIAHGTAVAGDSMPSGTLTFNSAGGSFDSIRIELPALLDGAQKFLIDDIVASPGGSTGGSMTLANPNWNITLTDFGYSDFLLDNTPGFVGREYLSGEWGSAVGYTRGNGNIVAPKWMEPQFLFPDWKTNSDYHVVQGIHLVGTNVDGLPVAESVIANNDLQITLRFEMVDTVTGTPMGVVAASNAGAPKSVDSNRYVMNQTFTIKNISGASLSNVQLFQLLHGYTSEHGVYDNRSYAGKLSAYQYDATLAGVDASSIGADGASSTGLEDTIAFHSKVAPTAFEIGAYGIEGNGLDDHSLGKPSDGVHLSIEDNWQTTPFLGRKNRDSFAPAARWVAGGQRWALGTIADGQSVNFDIVLSLLTGTTVTITGGSGGNNTGGGSCNGGSSHVGGVDFEFENIDTEGTFFGEYSEADEAEMVEREAEGEFALPTFQTPGGAATQLWNLEYSGTHNGLIHLTFAYDPALLPAGFNENTLAIYHYKGAAWERLTGIVDAVANKITVTTSSLSPFVLGVGPGFTIAASVSASGGGTIGGAGTYANGANVTLTATPEAGFRFLNWTENGTEVSNSPSYSFVASAGRTVVANFGLIIPQLAMTGVAPGNLKLEWPADLPGWVLQESPDCSTWGPSARAISSASGRNSVTISTNEGKRFFRLSHP